MSRHSPAKGGLVLSTALFYYALALVQDEYTILFAANGTVYAVWYIRMAVDVWRSCRNPRPADTAPAPEV